ncbi:MAG: enoyl-CoA hydratase-related protein, partial [Hyphomonadaceae bacterium]
MMQAYSTIKCALSENVLTLTFDRSDRLNALNALLIEEASAAIDEGLGAGARALLITGEGKAFSSGFDLIEAPARAKQFPNENLMDS